MRWNAPLTASSALIMRGPPARPVAAEGRNSAPEMCLLATVQEASTALPSSRPAVAISAAVLSTAWCSVTGVRGRNARPRAMLGLCLARDQSTEERATEAKSAERLRRKRCATLDRVRLQRHRLQRQQSIASWQTGVAGGHAQLRAAKISSAPACGPCSWSLPQTPRSQRVQ